MPARFGIGGMSGGRVWLVNEDCEGTGSPTGWTTANGTPNWDYTTTILADTQSLLLATTGVAVMTRFDFTNQSDFKMYFLFRMTGSLPGSAQNIMGVRPNGGGAPLFSLTITSTGRLNWTFGGQTASPSAALSLATTYHVWLEYKQGTGANGWHSVGYSTTGVRPLVAGTTYNFTAATSTATTQIGRIELGLTPTTQTVDLIYDNIRVSNTPIGDNGI